MVQGGAVVLSLLPLLCGSHPPSFFQPLTPATASACRLPLRIRLRLQDRLKRMNPAQREKELERKQKLQVHGAVWAPLRRPAPLALLLLPWRCPLRALGRLPAPASATLPPCMLPTPACLPLKLCACRRCGAGQAAHEPHVEKDVKEGEGDEGEEPSGGGREEEGEAPCQGGGGRTMQQQLERRQKWLPHHPTSTT